LDISRLKLSDPSVIETLKNLFPESAKQIDRINDDKNKTPVMIADQVVMPKSYKGKRVLSEAQYRAGINNLLQSFESNLRDFIQNSNEANAGWTQVTQAFANAYGGNGEETNSRKMAERYYKLALSKIDHLEQYYGYPSDRAIALRNQILQALKEDDKKIDAGLQQFQWACGAVAFAPLVWPAIALGGTGALVGMGIGLTFTGADILANAGIDAAYGNGDFVCNLGKQVMDKGPSGFLMALGFAGAGSLVQGGAKLTQAGLKALGVGNKALKALSLTATGALLAPGIYHTGESIVSARELTVLAQVSEANGQMELAREYRTLAAKAMANAAQGIAASVVLPLAAKYLAKSGPKRSTHQQPTEEASGSRTTEVPGDVNHKVTANLVAEGTQQAVSVPKEQKWFSSHSPSPESVGPKKTPDGRTLYGQYLTTDAGYAQSYSSNRSIAAIDVSRARLKRVPFDWGMSLDANKVAQLRK
jgi:hypothetical protein